MTEQGKEPFMKIDGYLIQVLESDKTSSESSECEDPINIPMEDTIPSSNIPESRYRTEMLPEEIANILGEVNRGEVPPISELELEEEMRELGDLEELPASVKEVVGGGKGGIGSIRDVEGILYIYIYIIYIVGEIQTEQMVHIKEEEVNVIVKKEGAINELLEMDDLPLDSDRTVSEDEDYRPGEGKDKHKRVEIYKRRERHVRHKRLRRNSGHGHNSDNSQTTYSKVRSRGIEKNRNPDPEPKPKPKGNHKSNHKPHKEREYRYSSESEHSRISYSSNSPEQEITKHSHSKHHLNTHKSYPKHNQHLRGTKKPDHARLVNKQVIHFGLPSKPHLSWDLDPHLSWDVDHYPYSLDNNNNNNGAPNNVDHMENRASTTKGSSSFLQSNQELRSRDRNFDFLVEENVVLIYKH